MSSDYSYGYTYDFGRDTSSCSSNSTYSDYYQHICENIKKITVTTSIITKGEDAEKETEESKGKED